MRVFVLSVLIVSVAAGNAAAQQPLRSTPVAPSTAVFSKTSIDRAVANVIKETPKTAAAAKTAPAPRRANKNFFKTPWPYIIAAGVAAGVLIAVYSGDDNGMGGPY